MNTLRFYQLVLVKVGLSLRSEASTSYLNYVWWILEPAFYVTTFYIVFGKLLHGEQPGFVTFLVCGQVPYLWYSRSVMNSSTSILAGRQLIDQIAIPKTFFPLVVMLQDFVKQMFIFVLLLIFLILCGIDMTIDWLYLVLIIATQALFTIASGMVIASIVPIIPDFRYIINTGMMLLMFGSGIFYSYEDVVEPEYRAMFLSNPMAALIKNYRQVLLEGLPPDFFRLMVIALVSFCVIIVSSYMLRRYSAAYSRLVKQ